MRPGGPPSAIYRRPVELRLRRRQRPTIALLQRAASAMLRRATTRINSRITSHLLLLPPVVMATPVPRLAGARCVTVSGRARWPAVGVK